MSGKPCIVGYRGSEMPLGEAIRLSGSNCSPVTVASRIARGWPLLRALHLPATTKRGVRMTMRPLLTTAASEDRECST